MSKWYLTNIDYIVGCFETKKEALQEVDAFHFRCHRKPYGYSIDVKDESEGWHCDSMWLMNKENLIKHGFSPQLAEYEEYEKEE